MANNRHTVFFMGEEYPNIPVGGSNSGGGGSGGISYSTEEQEIGTWIDGQPLYQKTFEYTITSPLSNALYEIISFPNIMPINMFGFMLNTSDNRVYPIPYAYGSATLVFVYKANGMIEIRVANDSWGTNYKMYVTVQYVKR